ncbi:MAG: hypothetical protein IID51_05375 [Proteobacteria bacterium]|nr:hypothetical protein [Pseudomonadota bacterium]
MDIAHGNSNQHKAAILGILIQSARSRKSNKRPAHPLELKQNTTFSPNLPDMVFFPKIVDKWSPNTILGASKQTRSSSGHLVSAKTTTHSERIQAKRHAGAATGLNRVQRGAGITREARENRCFVYMAWPAW